jgi:hypothetical protein
VLIDIPMSLPALRPRRRSDSDGSTSPPSNLVIEDYLLSICDLSEMVSCQFSYDLHQPAKSNNQNPEKNILRSKQRFDSSPDSSPLPSRCQLEGSGGVDLFVPVLNLQGLESPEISPRRSSTDSFAKETRKRPSLPKSSRNQSGSSTESSPSPSRRQLEALASALPLVNSRRSSSSSNDEHYGSRAHSASLNKNDSSPPRPRRRSESSSPQKSPCKSGKSLPHPPIAPPHLNSRRSSSSSNDEHYGSRAHLASLNKNDSSPPKPRRRSESSSPQKSPSKSGKSLPHPPIAPPHPQKRNLSKIAHNFHAVVRVCPMSAQEVCADENKFCTSRIECGLNIVENGSVSVSTVDASGELLKQTKSFSFDAVFGQVNIFKVDSEVYNHISFLFSRPEQCNGATVYC